MRFAFLFLFCVIYSLTGIGQVDSLLRAANTSNDTTLALQLYNVGKTFMSKSLDTSIMLFESGANLSERLEFVNGMNQNYRGISALAFRNGDLDKSITYVNKGLTLVGDYHLPKEDSVNFLINYGSALVTVNELGKAIGPFSKASMLIHKHNITGKKALVLNNLGIIYRRLHRHEEAIEVYNESLAMKRSLSDSLGIANSLFNRGATYAKMDSLKQSINDIKHAESIYKKLGKAYDVTYCKAALGVAYYDLGKMQEAIPYINYILEKGHKILSPVDKMKVVIIGAEYYYKQGDIEKAYAALKREASLIEDSDYIEEKLKYYDLMGNILSEKSRYKEAVEYKNQALALMDTKYSEENSKFTAEMESKYQTAEKDFEIKQLNIEKKISEIKLKASRQRSVGLLIGVILLAGLLWRLSQLNKKIKTQNKVITKANKEKEILLKEIHHRVKNNLQVVSSLLGLQSKFVEDDAAVEALNIGRSRVNSMSILHRKLYQNENLNDIKVKEYIEELCQQIQENYQLPGKNIKYHVDIDDEELDVDTVIPIGLIINEIISNSLKHGFTESSDGIINLSFKSVADTYVLKISDNGKGMPDSDILNKKKTLGSKLITSFTEKLKATLTRDTDNGTHYTICIPKINRLTNK